MKPQNLGPHVRAGVRRFGMALVLGALLAGCQSPHVALQELANTHQQRLEILDTSPFSLLLGVPLVAPTSTRLRIYLEGDGRAWATPSQPSLDPSPRNLLVARLAFADPQPSLYLARPCQFVSAPGCQPLLWTDRRFSAEVLDSLDAALTRIKSIYGNQTFELIGYSGGGALALLLATRRDDVAQVQTLAGNLTPREWVQLQKLSELKGSLEPLDYRQHLTELPQRHFAGSADHIVPASLLRSYQDELGAAPCLESIELPGVSHNEGWERAWETWRAQALKCVEQPQAK